MTLTTNIPAIICDYTKRHDLIIYWDATMCNPNGNPDADNQQRIDYETQRAFCSDASFKRRVRDTIDMIAHNENLANTQIFIKRDTFLSQTIGNAFLEAGHGNGEEVDGETETKSKNKKAKAKVKVGKDEKDSVNKFLRDNYWDVRMFGGVLIAGSDSDKSKNGGKVTGPLQVGFSLSVDAVSPESLSITRVCGDKPQNESSAAQTMGRKEIIHYGLFRTPVFYNPNIKSDSVSDKDLELFWFSILKMWDMTKTSSKNLALQKAVVFSHESQYGNAPSNQLFDLVKVKSQVEIPRSIQDYSITFNPKDVPDGVTATVLY